MRRILILLTAVALLVVSLAVGLLAADLPFWRRAVDLPLQDGERYLPVVYTGTAAAMAAAEDEPRVSPQDAARTEAVRLPDGMRAGGIDALLVMRGGELLLERYFSDGGGGRLRPADFLARPLASIAVGAAIADGRITSLDVPLSKYLPEWDDDPRGRITVRQLLDETSGLDEGIEPGKLLAARPFARPQDLPDFATARGVRLVLGNDFASTALGFALKHEPGGFFNLSPVNAQLAAVIVERATGIGFARYLEQRLQLPDGPLSAEFSLDRRSGMPAAHCCMRARGRDVLHLAEMLRNDGQSHGVRLLPAGWVAEMLKGSRANPEFGLQLRRTHRGGEEIWYAGAGTGGMFWILPARKLTVVVLAPRNAAARDDWATLEYAIRTFSK